MEVLETLFLSFCIHQIFWNFGLTSTQKVEHCVPPDYPEFGGYGPIQESYLPGDVIHYFCDTDTYIGGNYRRPCMDNGDWFGDTPVCDKTSVFNEYGQSSTALPESANSASLAIDGDRETCSKTLSEENGADWTATLADVAREAIRFMLYLPKGPVSYEVSITRADGSEVSCGRNTNNIVTHDWVFHNCLQPNNTNAVSVKVKSLTNESLEICEVVVHTLTDPTCVDPHFQVARGRLRLTRKTATLVCNDGYTRDPKSAEKLDCIRTGVWTRRNLRCKKILREVPDVKPTPSSRGEHPLHPTENVTSGNQTEENKTEP